MAIEMVVENGYKWRLIYRLIGDDRFTVDLIDPYGVMHSVHNKFVFPSISFELAQALQQSAANHEDVTKNKALINFIFYKVEEIYKAQKTFMQLNKSFFVINGKDGGCEIVFDSPGLRGGGRGIGMLAGAAQVATGIGLVISAIGTSGLTTPLLFTVSGAVCLGSGANGMAYAYKTNSGNFNNTEYLTECCTGAVRGGTAGAISFLGGAGIKAYGLTGMMKVGAVGVVGATAAVSGELTALMTELCSTSDLNRRSDIISRKFTKKYFFEKAVVGALGGMVSEVATMAVAAAKEELLGYFFKKILFSEDLAEQLISWLDSDSIEILGAAISGVVSGAASASVAKGTENVFNNKPILEGVKESALMGALYTGIMASLLKIAEQKVIAQERAQAKLTNEADKKSMENKSGKDEKKLDQKSKSVCPEKNDSQDKCIPSESNKQAPKNNKFTNSEKKQVAIYRKKQQRMAAVREEELSPGKEANVDNLENIEHKRKVFASPEDKKAAIYNKRQERMKGTYNIKAEDNVYYCSERLKNRWVRPLSFLSKEARHTGYIYNDPEKGLVRVEINTDKTRVMKLEVHEIEEFHRQTSSSKGSWSYGIGHTNVTLDESIEVARRWVQDHPTYKAFSDNCRAFEDYMLKYMFENDAGCLSLNSSSFFKSPCKAVEKNIRGSGFNTETHLHK